MWEKLKEWLRQWLGVEVSADQQQSPDAAIRRYENITIDNVSATIANKLAMLTFADSTFVVSEEGRETPGPRVSLIREALEELWTANATSITAQTFGKGGKVIVPVVRGKEVTLDTIDHNRFMIRSMVGNRITSATIILDTETADDVTYYLLADYELNGGTQTIRYRVKSENGGWYGVETFARWAGITPEITISGTDRLLFAYLRCPRDNRTDAKGFGVPITYGAETLIDELVEHANIYRREYKLTRPMLGLDATLWRKPGATMEIRSSGIDELRKTVQDGDDPFIPVEGASLSDKSVWQFFSPAIRQEAMENRYQSLCRRVEKACGLSQGILTERQTMNYANRDEVRAAQYDTFSTIKAMRDEWQRVLDDLAYAIDVLAERFGLTAAGSRGRYTLEYDWDTSLIESTTEAFQQNMELHAAGMVSDAEMRQWVRGGTIEENQEAIEEIRAERKGNSAIDRILSEPIDEGGEE
jgi:A118 family predicted phage portal protein